MSRSPRQILAAASAGLFVAMAASLAARAPRPAPQTPVRPGQARPAPTQPGPKTSAPTGTTAASAADPREATARRVCTQCHPFENIIAIRRTRAQWEATVENMVGRGARGTQAEFSSIIDFLAEKYGLSGAVVRGAAGPDDKPLVDPKADELARPLWSADCQACHGADARGTTRGPNLV